VITWSPISTQTLFQNHNIQHIHPGQHESMNKLTTPISLHARAKNFSHSISSVKRPIIVTLAHSVLGDSVPQKCEPVYL